MIQPAHSALAAAYNKPNIIFVNINNCRLLILDIAILNYYSDILEETTNLRNYTDVTAEVIDMASKEHFYTMLL